MRQHVIEITGYSNQEAIAKIKQIPLSAHCATFLPLCLDGKPAQDISDFLSAIPVGLECLDLTANLRTHLGINNHIEVLSVLQHKNLRQLVLSTGELGRYTGDELIQLFSVLPKTLHTLDLTYNITAPNQVQPFIQALPHLPKNIETLHLKKCADFIPLVFSNTSFIQVISALPSTLVSLNLNNVMLWDLSATESLELARALPPNLQKLHITGLNLEDPASFFVNLPNKIEFLEWSGFNITPAAFTHTISFLPPNITKIKFNESFDQFTQSEWITFLNALPKTLSAMDFGSIKNLSYETFELILKHLPSHITSIRFDSPKLFKDNVKPTSLIPASIQSIDFNLETCLHFDKILSGVPNTVSHRCFSPSFLIYKSNHYVSGSKDIKTVVLSGTQSKFHLVNLKPSTMKVEQTQDNTPILEISSDFDSLASLCFDLMTYPSHVQQIILNLPLIRRLDENTREHLRALLKIKFQEVIFNTDTEASRLMPSIVDFISEQNSSGSKPGINQDLAKLILGYVGSHNDNALNIACTNALPFDLLKDWIAKQPPATKDSKQALFGELEHFCQTADQCLEKNSDPGLINLAAFFTHEFLEGKISAKDYMEFVKEFKKETKDSQFYTIMRGVFISSLILDFLTAALLMALSLEVSSCLFLIYISSLLLTAVSAILITEKPQNLHSVGFFNSTKNITASMEEIENELEACHYLVH